MTTPSEFRKACKKENFTSHTSGKVSGYAQANLLVLPKEAAEDFRDLCFRNPVPCPLLGETLPGTPYEIDNKLVINDPEFDIRTDFPKYNIYENGKLTDTKPNINDDWNIESHIGFLIGCSFSFEKALEQNGFVPRNIKADSNVSMYITTKMLDSAGIFHNVPYIVSMRPYKTTDIEAVRTITKKFRKTHGEPIDWGFDAVKRLGIKDINTPEFGDPCEIANDEIPVFWACGVTPQIAASFVGDKIKGKFMGHTPGHMLVLDIKDEDVTRL